MEDHKLLHPMLDASVAELSNALMDAVSSITDGVLLGRWVQLYPGLAKQVLGDEGLNARRVQMAINMYAAHEDMGVLSAITPNTVVYRDMRLNMVIPIDDC